MVKLVFSEPLIISGQISRRDRNGKVSLTDIVLTVARALLLATNFCSRQSSPRTNLCYAASALVQFGSYLDTFGYLFKGMQILLERMTN